MSEELKLNWKIVAVGVGCTAAVAGIGAGLCSYQIIPPQSFGVEVRMGQMIADELQPGLHFKYPAYDNIYVFHNNTIIMEATLGTGNNTRDQNPLTALMRFHYQIDPKVGYMALHAAEMEKDGGKELLTKLMTQSVDAVVGSRSAVDTLQDPQTFLKAFHDNFAWRLKQNNVPIRADVVELLSLNVGALRAPIQARLRSDGQFEYMAGPAAINVPQDIGPGVSPNKPIPGPGTSTTPTTPKAP